ncbi:hypothetical protein [Glutamicibacter arilaitensis]|uniref:hypothetical protein n=1 Tax=Glutamicibacter arilaitensis TaxID=256701 RepID=UPI003F8EFEDB
MRKSARLLGQSLGLNAREMNKVLKEHGYLYGEPGAYGVTPKGKAYAQETDHSRGTGGYAQYNPTWEKRTWDESILTALRNEGFVSKMPAPGWLLRNGEPSSESNHTSETLDSDDSRGDDSETESPTAAIVAGAVFVAVGVATEVVIPWWKKSGRVKALELKNSAISKNPFKRSTNS